MLPVREFWFLSTTYCSFWNQQKMLCIYLDWSYYLKCHIKRVNFVAALAFRGHFQPWQQPVVSSFSVHRYECKNASWRQFKWWVSSWPGICCSPSHSLLTRRLRRQAYPGKGPAQPPNPLFPFTIIANLLHHLPSTTTTTTNSIASTSTSGSHSRSAQRRAPLAIPTILASLNHSAHCSYGRRYPAF